MARTATKTKNIGTESASLRGAKASWYGSRKALEEAALLRGNIGRVLRTRENGRDFICISAEKKSDVTKQIRDLVSGTPEIEYSNPVVCRKRKGSVVEIDGTTRIWFGIAEVERRVVKEAEPEPEKKAARGKKKKAVKATAKAKDPEQDSITALKQQIAQMQAQLDAIAEVL